MLDLFLPERCAACGEDASGLCEACLGGLAPLRGPLCVRCGAPVAWPVERCRECAGRRLAFASARAAVAYEGSAVRLVAAWKEGGQRGLAALAAAIVAEVVPRPRGTLVTYVPAARERALWRGHNPAEGLAAELAVAWGLSLVPLLARPVTSRRQRGLALAERRRNLAGAFAPLVRSPPGVVLVDDVYTTGATVSAAATALREGGARRVEVVTFARALRGRGSGCALR